jgi:hypothetical protein
MIATQVGEIRDQRRVNENLGRAHHRISRRGEALGIARLLMSRQMGCGRAL